MRVLVVEDHALVSGALRVLLESGGHEVALADSCAAATRACRERAPDLVLLDLTLPDGNALDWLEALAAGERPALVVALTGHDDQATRDRALAAGCHAVLLKPVPARELLALVRDWEGELRQRAATAPERRAP